MIGAGVVGAGAALDAASRGLKVALVEARDFASGTSSRSSKLVHGGLRYLKQLNFHLVFEALRERKLILEKLCPHLARPVEFIYPLEKPFVDRAWVGTGVGVYDVLGAGRGVPSHLRHLSKKATLRSFRSGKPGAIKGGIAFYEGQLDDARHTMVIARTAAEYGAAVASSTRVTSFLREGDKVVGAVARDLESGEEIRIRATATINAAGVWTDEIQEMIGGKGQFRVRASKGVHIVVPRDRIDSDTGLITETEKSLLFIIPCPWSDDFWVIGTTDTHVGPRPGPPGGEQRGHRLHPRARQRPAGEAADPRRRRRRVRGPAPAAGRRVRRDEQALARARVRQPRPRAGDRGRRQVHDVPGDGQGRRRPRRQGPRQAGVRRA